MLVTNPCDVLAVAAQRLSGAGFREDYTEVWFPAVEAVLGNRILSQFLMYRGALTIMEAVLAQRAA